MSEFEDYKKFFEEAPVALMRTNLKTGKFMMANRYAAVLLGYETVDELVRFAKSTDFYPPERRKQLVKELKINKVIENQEVELILQDGRKVWVRANFRVGCDGDCIECFMQDITEVVNLREKQLWNLKSLSEKIDIRIAAMV
jgi:PAS domain S-box-containing protein